MKLIERKYAQAWLAVAGGFLLATVAIFLWLAPRGFEYTDESFYLLSLVWRQEITSSFTLFGVALGGLFDVVGQDIVIFRVMGMLALLGSSAYMARAALRLVFADESAGLRLQGLVMLVVACSAMQYYAVFSTLRIPSYNLLAVCSLMMATGVMLGLLRAQRAGGRYFVRAVIYGGLLGLCAAAKVSTALLLAGFHLAYFSLSLRPPKLPALARAILGTVLGFALACGAVLAVQPDAAAILGTGLSISRTVDERYGPLSLVNSLRWDVQRQLREYWFVVLGLLVLGVGLRLRLAKSSWAVPLHRFVAVLAVLGCAAALSFDAWVHLWLLLAMLCWAWSWVAVDTQAARGQQLGGVMPLSLLLMALPLAFSFGTNGRVLEHSSAAAAPAVLGICLLVVAHAQRWQNGPGGQVNRAVVAVCLLVLAGPALLAQLRIVTDLHANYRQRVPLGAQEVEVRVGSRPSRLWVDEETRRSILALKSAAASAGFAPGTAVQDFTGDGAGIIYILGGRPAATAWMGGGYPGSEAAAAKLLNGVDPRVLQKAWLISSENNPRAIRNWKTLLQRHLGGSESHQVAASIKMRAPYDWQPDGPRDWEIVLWRPVAP